MKFSIVIPVYNVEKYIRDALDSVLRQSYPVWECICVDDGSMDDSGRILDDYCARDARFRVIHQINAGTGSARNAALDKVGGDWLLFLDGDDVFSPDVLETCKNAIERESAIDCVRFGIKKYGEFEVCKWGRVQTPLKLVNSQVGNMLTLDNYFGPFGARAYRFSLIKDIRFKTFCLGQDRAYFAEVIDRISLMTSVNRICYGYRQREGSAVHKQWGVRKFLAEIGWRMHTFNIWNKSQREIERRLAREYLLAMTEGVSNIFFSMNKSERKIVYATWMSELRNLLKYRFVPAYFKVSLFLNGYLRVQFVTWITLYLPYSLKRLGFHR